MRSAVFVVGALVASLNATEVFSEDLKTNIALYGQVEKMLLVYDDGKDTETNFADNSIGGTLFGFEGEQELGNGLTGSVLFEVSIADPTTGDIQQSTTAGQASTPVAGTATFAEEFARVGLSGDWGAIFLGQQDMAADGVTKEDLGGAGDLLISETTMIGGNLLFRNAATGASSGITVADVMTNNDEEALTDGIRYNTPEINGFSGSISTAQGGNAEVAVRYAKEYEGFSVSSALGYKLLNDAATASSNVDANIIKGAVSVKHDSGFAGTIAYGKLSRDLKATNVDDVTSYYTKLSYEWGRYAVAADFGMAEDLLTTVTNSEAKAIGVAAAVDLDKGVTAGLLWRQFSLEDDSAVNYDDINLFALNLGVKF